MDMSLFYSDIFLLFIEGQLPKGAAYLDDSQSETRTKPDEKPLVSPGEVSEYLIITKLNFIPYFKVL